MRKLNITWTSALIALLIQTAAAEPGAVVTLNSVDERVRAQNPDLAAARLLINEAVALQKQSGRLENPELELELEHNDRFAERSAIIGLSQRFPVTSRLRLEKERGVTRIRAAEKEVDEVANQLVGHARNSVVEVLAIRQQRDLVQRQAKVSKELADFISKAAEKGEGSTIDAGQARLESLQFSTELRRLQAEEKRMLGELKPLVGIPAGSSLTVSGGLPGLSFPQGSSVEGRPAMEAARLAVIEAEQQAEIERTKRYGDMQAGLFVGAERTVDAPGSAEKEAIIGVRVSIPLPWWDKNEGNIEAAEARAERRRKEVYALKQNIGLEAEAARAEMLEWAKLAREVESELLPQADEQTALSEQAWREGQGDLLTVLRSRKQRLDLAAARVDALKNFHLARVRYQTALGNP